MVKQSIQKAIEEAKALAEQHSVVGREWTVEVKEEKWAIEVTVEVISKDAASPSPEDAPWTEWGGNEVVKPLEAAGFRQKDCWTGVFRRKTFGGGEVEEYRDGVLFGYQEPEEDNAD